jgi:hypothetical protein
MTEIQKTLGAIQAYEAEFDQALDQEFGGLCVADRQFTASEILKTLDPKAYRTGLGQFFWDRLHELLELDNLREESE